MFCPDIKGEPRAPAHKRLSSSENAASSGLGPLKIAASVSALALTAGWASFSSVVPSGNQIWKFCFGVEQRGKMEGTFENSLSYNMTDRGSMDSIRIEFDPNATIFFGVKI